MITLQETIELERPVAEVYDYLVHIENTQKWQPAVIEVTRLTEGPIRVGTQFREVAKMMGRRIHTTCEITRLEPNRIMAFEGTSDGPLEYRTTYTLEPNGSGTRLRIEGSFRTRGIWRLLEPILKSEVKKGSRQELTAMKRVIETRAA
jgi:uncharacterized protein YndB with AHSA1/START domain